MVLLDYKNVIIEAILEFVEFKLLVYINSSAGVLLSKTKFDSYVLYIYMYNIHTLEIYSAHLKVFFL